MREVVVGFLAGVADGLGLDRPLYVAQSMGGLWTTWLALDRPERVSAISYVGCPAFMLGTSAPFVLRFGSLPVVSRLVQRLDRPSPKQVDRFTAIAGEDWSDHPEIKALFLEFERLPGCRRALFELIHAGVRLRGPRPEVELTESQLARIDHPVQMIWGENDTFGPAATGERAQQIISDAELHVVPGGHAPWVDEPERVAALVDTFLRSHTGDTTSRRR